MHGKEGAREALAQLDDSSAVWASMRRLALERVLTPYSKEAV